MKRIRPGLYRTEDKRISIERMDEAAEVYPENLDYGEWRVTEHGMYDDNIWLSHFPTLKAAKEAIGV